MRYLDKNYLDTAADRRRWMFCHRNDISYAWINTNNYIESWHNTLKKHFFRNKQQRRIDSVLYILAHKAIPHYQQRCVRHMAEVGRMNSAKKKKVLSNLKALDFMERKQMEDPGFAFLSPTTDDTVFRVPSFKDSSVTYEVTVDWAKGLTGHITSCTCPEYFQSKMCCKHIALAAIHLPYTEFCYAGRWEARDQSLLIELPHDQEDGIPEATAAAAWAKTEIVHHFMKRLTNLFQIMDVDCVIPNAEELIRSLKTTQELCDMYIPVQSEHNL
ncbi:hypothetical protein BGZ99_001751, partial [Dissophora globulifera]